MKLRNKKTGEIGNLVPTEEMKIFRLVDDEWNLIAEYDTLTQLNKDWEDYEEPIDLWTINILRQTPHHIYESGKYRVYSDNDLKMIDEVGLLFETKEEAEKAVEKLKAWKRLKDRGFRVHSYDFDYLSYAYKDGTPVVKVICDFKCETEEDKKDLELLFGGEE